jgi:hypothetical protein
MRSLLTGAFVSVVVLFGCGGDVDEMPVVAEGAASEDSESGLDANGDPKSKFRHLPLAGGGEAFVQGSGDANKISPSDVSQGSLSDCWVLAPLVSIARTNPAAIERLIQKRSDGAYDVTLYMGDETTRDGVVERAPKVLRVMPTFATKDDGSLVYAKPMDAGPNGPELWPLLIEKAYAQHFGRYDGPIPVIGRDLNGNTFPAFNALTPRGEYVTHNPHRESDDEIGDTLAEAFANGKPVVALTMLPEDGREADKYGIVTWHFYSVAGVNREAKTLDLEDSVRKRTGARNLPFASFRSTFARYHVGPSLR